MSNRVMSYLIVIVLISVVALLLLNLAGIQSGSLEKQFLKPNNVKSVEVFRKDTPYPMNLEQQTTFIKVINHAVATGDEDKLTVEKIPFDYDKIVIYRIEGAEITATPYGMVNTQLLLSVPAWNPDGLIRETGPGELNALFTKVVSSTPE